jgi:type I restriction enzyme S subunit
VRKGAKNDMKINNAYVLSEKIFVPSLSEQRKMATFFNAIDQKISQLKKRKNLLEQYRKGITQKILSKKIRFKDVNGNDFPKWENINGNSIFETVSNKNHNSDLPILAITQEHGAIPRNLIDFKISVSEHSIELYKVVEKGDFIISLRSFQGGIEYSDYKGICSPAYIILRAYKDIDCRYFKYYFKTDKYITELNKKIEGIRDGKMVSFKYFSEIKINVPSLPEQTKIANFLSAINDKINQTQKQIEKVEAWEKGLLQQMFC